jgi:hypothetical protein
VVDVRPLLRTVRSLIYGPHVLRRTQRPRLPRTTTLKALGILPQAEVLSPSTGLRARSVTGVVPTWATRSPSNRNAPVARVCTAHAPAWGPALLSSRAAYPAVKTNTIHAVMNANPVFTVIAAFLAAGSRHPPLPSLTYTGARLGGDTDLVLPVNQQQEKGLGNAFEHRRFVAMRSHNGHDSFFCASDGTHEQGRRGGRSRPSPPLPSHPRCRMWARWRLGRRHISGRTETVGEEAAGELLLVSPLPAEQQLPKTQRMGRNGARNLGPAPVVQGDQPALSVHEWALTTRTQCIGE